VRPTGPVRVGVVDAVGYHVHPRNLVGNIHVKWGRPCFSACFLPRLGCAGWLLLPSRTTDDGARRTSIQTQSSDVGRYCPPDAGSLSLIRATPPTEPWPWRPPHGGTGTCTPLGEEEEIRRWPGPGPTRGTLEPGDGPTRDRAPYTQRCARGSWRILPSLSRRGRIGILLEEETSPVRWMFVFVGAGTINTIVCGGDVLVESSQIVLGFDCPPSTA
jgi:hypothetical protein